MNEVHHVSDILLDNLKPGGGRVHYRNQLLEEFEMKKISVMILAAFMLFAFVACDPEEGTTSYTPEETVISYIDSINREKVVNDLIASAKGEESSVVLEFDLDAITIGESTEIPFTVTIADGKDYSTGFWTDEVTDRKVTEGSATVVVEGSFDETATGTAKATFTATGYRVVGSGKVTDSKYGEHTLEADITGDINAKISLVKTVENGMEFRLEPGFSYGLPAADSPFVSIRLDGTTVDYAEVYEAVADHTGNISTEN